MPAIGTPLPRHTYTPDLCGTCSPTDARVPTCLTPRTHLAALRAWDASLDTSDALDSRLGFLLSMLSIGDFPEPVSNLSEVSIDNGRVTKTSVANSRIPDEAGRHPPSRFRGLTSLPAQTPSQL